MLYTALALGFLGSLHCAGMCGPIAMALPRQSASRFYIAFNSLFYNLGRTFTYALIGLFFGLIGESLRLAGWQSGLSVAMGILFVVFAFFAFDFEKRLLGFSFLNRFYGWIQVRLGAFLRTHAGRNAFFIGLLNGFLPCGLVYAAVFGAISAGSMLNSVLFMAFFGLGTIPLMFSIGFFGQWLSAKWRSRLRSLIPAFLTVVGLLLIARGLNFDLPYDFRFWQDAAHQPICH